MRASDLIAVLRDKINNYGDFVCVVSSEYDDTCGLDEVEGVRVLTYNDSSVKLVTYNEPVYLIK